jgi:hypothetical protein
MFAEPNKEILVHFLNTVVRALRLDKSVFTELYADPQSLTSAIAVVTLSNVFFVYSDAPFRIVIAGVIGSIGGYLTITAWIYYLGNHVIKHNGRVCTYSGLLRAMGFAYAPNVLRILGFNSALLGFFNLVAAAWMMAIVPHAIKQAFELDTWAPVLKIYGTAIVTALVLAGTFAAAFLR